MKTMKKLMTLVLSIAMVLAMSVTAFADDATTSTYKITVKNATDGHTYEAYQIFKGDLSDNILSNVTWGDGITEDGKVKFGDAAQKAETLAEDKSANAAATFAKEVAEYLTNNGVQGKYDSTKGEYTISGLTPGYYLVKDSFTKDAQKDDFISAYIMQVVKNVEVEPKGDKPSVEKKVKENVKGVTGNEYGDGYNDVADYNIGDAVPFHLIGRVPDMSGYDSYKYIFTDTLSSGLTAPKKAEEVKVYLSSDKKKDDSDVEISYNESTNPNGFKVTITGQTITVESTKLNGIAGVMKDKYIIVEYSAVLNQNAVIGLSGNENKVDLKYSNNPNGDGIGKTPEDKVIVFTYELDATKVDGGADETKTLAGAKFKLLRKNSDGSEQYAKFDTANKVIGWGVEEEATELVSDENGKFGAIGLDDGTYYLRETLAPSGYNLLKEDIEIKVKATTVNNQSWDGDPKNALTKLEVDVKVNNKTTTTGSDENRGVVKVTVENNQGSTLPSTGGMGTTIFYVVGTILVLAAAVLLITKKRMHADK
ncbi:MAG: SpaH/EbpB family LPXTG-anchored major pilin [Lachnospiraceae bacterium]|nr:SpaH/EbpB family LPXTG-anchored major pilin [Lachnospiraceae bacterium]